VVGNGKTTTVTMVGCLRRIVIQLDGAMTEITIHNVTYVPELYVILFSVNTASKGNQNQQ
jgi:hypothetical protein